MTRTAKAVKPKPKIYKPATRKEAQARQLERLEGRTEGLKKDMKTQTRGKKQVLVRQFNSVTIFDLIDLTKTPEDIFKWMQGMGVFECPTACAECGEAFGDPVLHPDKTAERLNWVYRCGRPCRRRTPLRQGSWFQGRRFSDNVILWALYEWCHGTTLLEIQLTLGLNETNSFYRLIDDFQSLVCLHDTPPLLDGVVEADEYEQGRHQKGIHGHPTSVKADIRGVFQRGTGLCNLEVFQKLKPDGDRRKGPPSEADVVPFVKTACAPCILFTDGAKAYCSLAGSGFTHFHVSHTDGEWFRDEKIMVKGILKDFSVNTNGIDGLWGKYTVWIGSKFGVSRAKTPGYVKEYQWRTNHASEDLFDLALSYMAE